MVICCVPFWGHCVLDLWHSISNNIPILFEVGIRNSICDFILGWQSGAYQFRSRWPRHWLLTSFLGFSCLEHASFITNNFPQKCFTWPIPLSAFDTLLWHFLFFIRRLGPTVYRSPPKISGISSTQKSIWNFSTPSQKKPHSVPFL